MNIKEAAGLLPDYDEIMDRQREAQEMKAEQREEKIAAIQKEYFGDVGTFFEWIQSIEISKDDADFFIQMHQAIHIDIPWVAGIDVRDLFARYCEEKAIEDVDG